MTVVDLNSPIPAADTRPTPAESDRLGPQDRRRAAVYVILLGAAMIVATIGLGTLAVSRVQLRSVANSNDLADARQLALSAIEHALQTINTNDAWRDTFTHGVTAASQNLNRGSFRWVLTDDLDANLKGNPSQSATLTGVGAVNSARFAASVLLVPIDRPLEVLNTAAHAHDQLVIVKTVGVAHLFNGPLSTNNQLQNNGTINGDVEAVVVNKPGTISGSLTSPVPEKVLPDSSVFDMYRSLGTAITLSGTLTKTVFSPAINDFGPTNADGVYYIDTRGADLTLNGVRVLGTLVVDCDSGRLIIEDQVFIEPYRADYPSLIVNGRLELNADSTAKPLSEAAFNVSLNPPGAAYQSVSDTDTVDLYPNEIRGLVHARGDVYIGNQQTVNGALITEGKLEIDSVVRLIHDPNLYANPPLGYTMADPNGRMAIAPASWRRSALPP